MPVFLSPSHQDFVIRGHGVAVLTAHSESKRTLHCYTDRHIETCTLSTRESWKLVCLTGLFAFEVLPALPFSRSHEILTSLKVFWQKFHFFLFEVKSLDLYTICGYFALSFVDCLVSSRSRSDWP